LTTPSIVACAEASGAPSSRAITCTSSTEQAATADRNSSPGVTASPGQPFCTGPSTT
jgi:hypothetical protein